MVLEENVTPRAGYFAPAAVGAIVGLILSVATVFLLFDTGVWMPKFGGLFGEGQPPPTDYRVWGLIMGSIVAGAVLGAAWRQRRRRRLGT